MHSQGANVSDHGDAGVRFRIKEETHAQKNSVSAADKEAGSKELLHEL